MANNYETTTKFKVDISELKKEMQEAKRQIALANSEFKAVSSSMDNWAKSTTGLQAKLKQLDSNLESQKTVLSSLERQYELTVDEMGEGSAEAERLKIAINNQQAVVNKTAHEIDNLTDELDRVAEAERIASRTGKDVSDVLDEMDREAEQAEQGIQDLSGGFTVMKGVLANLIADGIRTAISALKDMATAVVDVGSSFSTSMAEVQAISGASAEELEQLEKTAREFGSTTVFSASESADALKYMALAGWSVEESTSALGGVLNLASASGMELAQASDMVTDYLSAFGLEAKDSAMFADMLAYAQSNSNTSAEQLGEAFKNCSAVLNASGQDVQTTTALLASMANQGLKGSEAGTALTAMMRDLTDKMKDGKIMIGETAVTVMDANGNYRDMTEILKDVESATQGMGDAEKATALSATFTADSIKGLNLILNDGVSNAETFEEALRNSGGTAEEMSAIMTDNLAGDVKAFQSALEELALKVYDALEPALRDIIAFVQDLANQFNEWLADPTTKEAIDELGAKLTEFVQGALTTVMDVIKWFIANKDSVIAGLYAIGAGFAVFKIAGMITGLVTVFTALFTALQSGIGIMKALNLAFGITPIGLLITGISLLVGAFVYFWNTSEEFRDFWINLWETIKNACSIAIDAIVNFFTVTVPQAFQSVLDWVQANWQALLLFLINPFAGLFKYFYDNNSKFQEFVDNAVNIIKQMPEKVWTWLLNTINKVVTWRNDMVAKANETAQNFVNKIVEWVKQLPEKVWTWLINVITKVTTFASNLRAKATEAGNGFTEKLISAVKDLPEKFFNIGSDIVSGIWNGISSGWEWLTGKVKDLAGSLLKSAKEALDINSPSKEFEKQVGKWIPAGIAVGIDKNAKTALNSVKNLAMDMVGATSQSLATATTTGGVSGGVVNNYTQVINSPKQLNRLDIYRQSKNLLGYAGGGF